jgi:hypothetical protein
VERVGLVERYRGVMVAMTYTRKRWFALALIVAAPVAATIGLTVYFNPSRPQGILHDPNENEPELQAIFRAAEKQTDEELKGEPRELGFIHRYWNTKKRILKEKHNLYWRTPAEMNPNVRFD